MCGFRNLSLSYLYHISTIKVIEIEGSILLNFLDSIIKFIRSGFLTELFGGNFKGLSFKYLSEFENYNWRRNNFKLMSENIKNIYTTDEKKM